MLERLESIFSNHRETSLTLTAMRSILQKLILPSILMLSIMVMGCGKDSGGGGKIDMELIEVTTELPSKVRLFFQVDFGDNPNFRDLTENDFEIYENKLLISALESQSKIQNETGSFLFSSILLLDLSGSVLNGEALPRVIDASVNYIENVMPTQSADDYGSTEMAVYWFDGEEDIHLLSPFTIDRNAIIDSVQAINSSISTDNSTNLNGAVIQGLLELETRISDNNQDPRVSTAGSLVMFSDGADQAGRAEEAAALSAVSSLGEQYSVFTIGLGSDIDESFLNRVGKDGFVTAEDSFDLNTEFIRIANSVQAAINSYVVLEYCSPKRSGDHDIELRAVFDNKTGRFTTEFDATGFTGGCVIQ